MLQYKRAKNALKLATLALKRARGAGDKANVMLNYGYALLESECLRSINSVGLDAHVGFLHEMDQSKYSLAYDLQEPFRFVVDLVVMNLIEKGAMDNKDFIRNESYSLRLRPYGARKLVDEFQNQLNKKVNYQNKQVAWSYVIPLKIRDTYIPVNMVGVYITLEMCTGLCICPHNRFQTSKKKVILIFYTLEFLTSYCFYKSTIIHEIQLFDIILAVSLFALYGIFLFGLVTIFLHIQPEYIRYYKTNLKMSGIL